MSVSEAGAGGAEKLLDTQGVENSLGRKPGASGLLHSEGEIFETGGGVGVGAEHEHRALAMGLLCELGVEIEATAAPIELQRNAEFHAGFDHGVEVVAVAIAPAQDAAGGVPKTREQAGAHAFEQAL